MKNSGISGDLQIWELKPFPISSAIIHLLCEYSADRLQEVISRWVHWVASLWSWLDKASFALRYAAKAGAIRVYSMARAQDHHPLSPHNSH